MTVHNFDKLIYRKALTCVYFFAEWCPSCQKMRDAAESFQKRMNGRVDVYTIDVDNRNMEEVFRRYTIDAVPTVIFFQSGQVLWRNTGVMSYEELENSLIEVEKHTLNGCEIK